MIPWWLLKLFGFGWLIEPGYSLLACFVAALVASFLGVLIFDSFVPKNKTLKKNWFLIAVLCIPILTVTFLLMSLCGGGGEKVDVENSKNKGNDNSMENGVTGDSEKDNNTISEENAEPTEQPSGEDSTTPSQTVVSSGNLKENTILPQGEITVPKKRLDFVIRKNNDVFVLTTKIAGVEKNEKSNFVRSSIVSAMKNLSDKAPDDAEIHITLDGLTEQNIQYFRSLIKEQIPSVSDENITERNNQ